MDAIATPGGGRPRLWLIVSQTVMVLALLPWLLMTSLSLAGYTAEPPPGAGEWAMRAVLLYAYPVYALVFSVLAWRARRRGNARRAMVLTSIPLVPALLLLFFLAWAVTPPV